MIDAKARVLLIQGMAGSQVDTDSISTRRQGGAEAEIVSPARYDKLKLRNTEMISSMSLQPKDVHGQRICVITGKFLPTYAHVQVDEESGQIGLLFDVLSTPRAGSQQSGGDVVSTNKDLPATASLQWYSPELLARMYEVKPNDLEFGLGCPLAIKEADLTECRYCLPPAVDARRGREATHPTSPPDPD